MIFNGMTMLDFSWIKEDIALGEEPTCGDIRL